MVQVNQHCYILAGNLKPYRGKIVIRGKDIISIKNNELYDNNLVLLPKNPMICLF